LHFPPHYYLNENDWETGGSKIPESIAHLWAEEQRYNKLSGEANVGLFYKLKGDPILPDMLLSLGVQRAEDFSQRRNRSYFVWEFGKVPDVCIEIVSNQEDDELILSQKSQQKGKATSKKDIYAQIGVPYYAMFDPLRQIQDKPQMNGALLRVWTLASGRYEELTPDKKL
jgi:hypothetical protein